jgi:hypothetical protein
LPFSSGAGNKKNFPGGAKNIYSSGCNRCRPFMKKLILPSLCLCLCGTAFSQTFMQGIGASIVTQTTTGKEHRLSDEWFRTGGRGRNPFCRREASAKY